MGHKHTREQILEGAVATAVDDGLSQLTFGRVAKRLGVSDRIVVYYFPSKTDLVSEVLASIGVQMQTTLAGAFTAPATGHVELVRASWPELARPEADKVFALFIEAIGLSAAGREPFATLIPPLFDAWIDWVATFVDAPKAQRRGTAEAALAIVEGLLLVRQIAGPAAADRAARRILGAAPKR